MTGHLFSGLKVLDVGSWIAGPVAGTMLADFGADVIKVEMPGVGDQYRILSATPGTPDADVNYMWQLDGRNKRSITLNLKSEEGMSVLHKLIASCDVYITNNPLPMRRSLKLTYDDLKPLNPSMIYASLTAYGEEGPDKDMEGFDLVAYWGRTGMMDLVRATGAAPAQALPGMGDHHAAVSLYASIVTALLHRERTGEGGMVHTSLLANGLWSMSCIAQAGFAGGSYERYREFKGTSRFATTLYRTRDDRWFQFTMIRGPGDFEALMEAIGLGDMLGDPRFQTPESRLENGEALSHLVQGALLREDAEYWIHRFAEAGLNSGPVGIVEEIIDDPQVHLNGMVVPPVDGDMGMPYVINHPVKAAHLPQVGPKRAPDVGEHSDEVLEELGYTAEAISDLRSRGII